MELFILLAIAIGILLYRGYQGNNVSKFFTENVRNVYHKFSPYSFQEVRKKAKELGQEYTMKQYVAQAILFSGFTAAVTYLYFYNIFVSLLYVIVVIGFIPYLSYLRCKRIYSEFIFEQVQVYTTNTIMEFATTQSFVRSLENVVKTGVLENPILDDVNQMIELAYQNGSIDESLNYMTNKYPYYIVKNMHQLFLQITKEGARDAGESLDNMQLDIDMLVESVYRDRIDRASFHKGFLRYGIMLYLLVMITQYLLGNETYLGLLEMWYVNALLHFILIANTYFLLKGEKYYNENVGAE